LDGNRWLKKNVNIKIKQKYLKAQSRLSPVYSSPTIRNMKFLTIFAVLAFAASSYAHEGHSHSAEPSAAAPSAAPSDAAASKSK
jgi:hypothetical protein